MFNGKWVNNPLFFYINSNEKKMGIETKDNIQEMIEPVLDEHGLELVELQLRKEGSGLVLRIIIYRDGGINIEDCTVVSREVGYLLEVNDPLSKAYTLEVSSPGLDRLLKTARDFERIIGKKIFVQYEEECDSCSLTGMVEDVVEQNILILKTAKKEVNIPLVDIIRATQVIEF